MFTTRQLEIIDAAIELIAEEGIQKLTIKNLSARVNLTEGAIYRHFTSKMEILQGILKLFKKQKDELVARIAGKNINSLEQLKQIFEQHFVQFSSKPALAAIIFAEEIFQNDKQLADSIASIMEANQKVLEEIIAQGQKKGEIRNDIPKEQLALIILGSIRLIVAKWHLFGYQFDLKKEGMDLYFSINKMIAK